jgi:chromosome segregation ATPase
MRKRKYSLASDRDTCRSKIESLKDEKRDFEKTLEREIREKNELKAQVTNILQEIGRLEGQPKEVRSSHSSIQAEKQKFEVKIKRIQRQHDEVKSKLEKEKKKNRGTS